MARPPSTHPTDGEIEILEVFWKHGDCTARDVHDELLKNRDVSQTTVATMIRIMIEKGILSIHDERRPQIFRTKITREKAVVGMLKKIKKNLLGGSVKKLIMHALSDAPSSEQELSEIKKILEKHAD